MLCISSSHLTSLFLLPPAWLPLSGIEKQTRTLPPPHFRRSIATSLRNLYGPYSLMAKAIRYEFWRSYVEELVGPHALDMSLKCRCDTASIRSRHALAQTAIQMRTCMLPPTTREDIINYLVFSTNCLSLQRMKAFKTLDAHNYFRMDGSRA